MTVAVGYLAGKGGRSALSSGRRSGEDAEDLADRRHRRATPWITPSLARIDAEYAQYAEQLARRLGQGSAAVHRPHGRRARRQLSQGRPPLGVRRPAGGGRRARRRGAGAGFGVRRQARPGGGRLDRRPAAALLAGAAGDQPPRLPRVESRRADPDHVCVSRHTGVASKSWSASRRSPNELDVPMRVVTFAVRGRTMYPPEVGLHAEDSILEAVGVAGARDVGEVEGRRRRRRRR